MRSRTVRLFTATLAVILLGGALAWQVRECLGSTQDEAFVGFRYARNLSSGIGLVYNPGEREERDPDVLWTGLLAGAMRMGSDPAPVAALFGTLSTAAILALVMGGAFVLTDPHRAPGAAAFSGGAFFVAGSAVAAESVQGLDTALFTLLVTGALLRDAVERKRGRRAWRSSSGWLYGLCAVARAEGLAAFTAAALVRTPALLRRRGMDHSAIDRRGEMLWMMQAVVPAAALLGVRWFDDRDVVARALRAGGAAIVGGRWGGSSSILELAGAYLPVLALAVLAAWRLRGTETVRLLGAWGLALAVWAIIGGGRDHPNFRALWPVLPALCVLAGAGLVAVAIPRLDRERTDLATGGAPGPTGFDDAGRSSDASRATRLRRIAPWATAWALFGACIVWLWVGSDPSRRVAVWRRGAIPTQAAAGRWLAARFPSRTRLATTNAGTIPFYSDLPTIDMRDRAGAFVLSRKPDLVLFSKGRFSTGPITEAEIESRLSGGAERELWNDPSFHALYRLESITLPGFTFNYFERVGREAALERRGR